MTLEELNALPGDAAAQALEACCGSSTWVSRMLEARPFAGRDALLELAETSWRALTQAERRSIIAHHARLGEARAAATTSALARDWSAQEQAGARVADDVAQERLAEGNAEYERRFGHAFIVCATGMTVDGMLDALERRLRNDATTEWSATDEELRRITMLRLDKLLTAS
ncbi:MAG: 2-oxo-4-hydroxy-4-carboxy-5-ureidoimidazoline decarboxylase [Gemmatimonadales bacterium]